MQTQWNIRALLINHLLAALLLITLFSPLTRPYWRVLDTWFFIPVNNSLALGKGWQTFWALANHKIHDWIEDAIFFVLVLFYIFKKDEKSKKLKALECLLMIIVLSLTLYIVGRLIFRQHFRVNSPSPTWEFPDCYRLSHLLPHINIKDKSPNSFPGDHATTAILFGSLFGKCTTGLIRKITLCYCTFLCLPRLIVGAHWLTDILIGSGSVVLVVYALYYHTPLHKLPEKLLRKRLNSSKSSAMTH